MIAARAVVALPVIVAVAVRREDNYQYSCLFFCCTSFD